MQQRRRHKNSPDCVYNIYTDAASWADDAGENPQPWWLIVRRRRFRSETEPLTCANTQVLIATLGTVTPIRTVFMAGDGTPKLSLCEWNELLQLSLAEDVERLLRSARRSLDLSRNQVWAEYIEAARVALRERFGIIA
jgi:hypothetical protein